MTAGTTADVAWPRQLLRGVSTAGMREHRNHLAEWGPLPRLSADELLAMVDRSGLLGRGGAGFPTGRKMRTVAAGRRPVLVANGCEGEPASAKDALLLDRVPHLVLDGIQLAAKAVGAREAHVVVHRGTGTADVLRRALGERRDATPVDVHELPSRYVASEESAIVHWLNGGEARPTFTPPRPFERGVAKRPTLVNNVETLAHLATIARCGVEWFRSVGDPGEPGTLLVTLRGDGFAPAVVEVPTGTSIGQLAVRAGIDLHRSRGVLVGGYFGTWLPPDHAAQLPLSQRGLRSAGAALGAGVVAVLPPDRCGLVETARVATYLAADNAEQCGPCLNGLPAIAAAVRGLATGRWDDRRWAHLERWLDVVPGRGACRHPDGAVRFVATALSTFAADVAQHRRGQPCAAARAPEWLPVPWPPTDEWR